MDSFLLNFRKAQLVSNKAQLNGSIAQVFFLLSIPPFQWDMKKPNDTTDCPTYKDVVMGYLCCHLTWI